MEIPKVKQLEEMVLAIQNAEAFQQIALEVYNFQFSYNKIYQDYCRLIKRTPEAVKNVSQIPFLPISFFKTHQVVSGVFEPDAIFKSSGTTGVINSRHIVKDLDLYRQSFLKSFSTFFGVPDQCCILGLLPSYLEREDSSLVYMVNSLIVESGHADSGFYLYDFESLHQLLLQLERQKQEAILFGVSYALLDFAEQYPIQLRHTKVVETGGMKGRKTEIPKAEVYEILRKGFECQHIYSEYGMTELLSQAYAVDGIYHPPAWMRVILRDETDPLSTKFGSGAINIIDLANLYSCSFIATDDLGKLHADGSFEVLGRLDNSDIRGCSQLLL